MNRRRMADARSLLTRALALALVWAILTDADPRSPVLAGTMVAVAVAASMWLVPPGTIRIRWQGAMRFVPFFLRESALGGIDVARRALDPQRTVEPQLVEHQLSLAPGPPRTAFVAMVSLLPGTLSAELRHDRLRVHVLDRRMRVSATLAGLETRIADLFGDETSQRK